MAQRTSFGSLLRIAIPLEKNQPNRFLVDLTPVEFSVIGFTTVQWAFLESALFQRTRKLAKKARTALPAHARNLSFTRRLQTFREVAQRAEASNPKQLAKYTQLSDRIANAEGTRHRLLHGLWEFNPIKPESLLNFGRDSKGRIVQFDVEKIGKFAESLGTLSFELTYPRGWTQRRLASRPSFVSRQFVLAMAGKDPFTGLDRPSAKTKEE